MHNLTPNIETMLDMLVQSVSPLGADLFVSELPHEPNVLNSLI